MKEHSMPASIRLRTSPAPWTMAEASASIPIRDGEGRTVASVKYRPKDHSDAKLIAASPDLFEALEECLTNSALSDYQRKLGEEAIAKALRGY